MPRGKRQWLRERCDYIAFHVKVIDEYLEMMERIIPDSYEEHHRVITVLREANKKQGQVVIILKGMF